MADSRGRILTDRDMVSVQRPFGPTLEANMLRVLTVFIAAGLIALQIVRLTPDVIALVGLALVPIMLFRYDWVLLFLIVGLGFGGRAFAYIHIEAGVPLYVTEVALGAVLAAGVTRCLLRDRVMLARSSVSAWVSGYLMLGVLHALAGWSVYGQWALRDSAITYYALFYFIFLYATRGETELRRFLTAAALALFLPVLATLRQFSFADPLGVFGTANELLLGLLTSAMLALWPIMRWRGLVGGLLVGALAHNLFLYIRRAFWFGLGVPLLFLKLQKWHVSRRSGRLILLSIPIVAAASLLWLEGGDVTARVSGEFARGRLDQGGYWRFIVWERYLDLAMEHWLFGWGFGFQPAATLVNPNPDHSELLTQPHNAFIHVFFRMGIVGLTLLVGILVAFYRSAARHLRSESDDRSRACVLALLAAHLFVTVFASFHVVLENAYNGIWFWSLMGMTDGFIRHRRAA